MDNIDLTPSGDALDAIGSAIVAFFESKIVVSVLLVVAACCVLWQVLLAAGVITRSVRHCSVEEEEELKRQYGG